VSLVALAAAKLAAPRGVLLAAGLLALSPTQIHFAGMASTECLSTLLMGALIATVMAWQPARSARRQLPVLVGLGLLGGVGMLTRSNFVALLGLTLPVLALSTTRGSGGSRWLQLLLPLGISVACVAPWLIRNYLAFGSLLYSTKSGLNLLAGFSDTATGGFTLSAVPCLEYPEYTEVSRSAIYRGMAFEWIAAHPGEAVLLVVKKFLLFLNPFPATVAVAGPVWWAIGCYNAVLLGVGLAAIPRALGTAHGRLLVCMLLGYSLPVLLTFALTRFRVPVEPTLAVLSAFWLHHPQRR
jgi:hypothetical protein